MPTTSREAFLTNVRRSLGRPGFPSSSPKAASRTPANEAVFTEVAVRDKEDLIALFAEEVGKVHGAVSRVSGMGEVESLLGALIEEKGVRKIARWNTPTLALLDNGLRSAGAEVLAVDLEGDEKVRSELRNELIAADMGLTEVDYAVADIGSLVLRASEPQSRLASVLPSIHVAIVTPDKIVGSLADLLPLLNSGNRLPSAVSLVTGPSRTADIETIRTVGIHGPVELHVIILDEG